MTNAEQIQTLMEIVARIADAEYQERVWIRAAGPEFDSWVETICQFFDDYQADEILKEYSEALGITRAQYSKLNSFKDALAEFAEKYRTLVPDRQIVEDPDWARITKMANEVLVSIRPI